MAMWIRKDYDSATHEIGHDRERGIVNGDGAGSRLQERLDS